jgi:hypothetical protein
LGDWGEWKPSRLEQLADAIGVHPWDLRLALEREIKRRKWVRHRLAVALHRAELEHEQLAGPD